MKNSTLFLELLTVLLIVLKLTGHTDISWLMCLLPVLLPMIFTFLIVIAAMFLIDGTEEDF